MVSKLDSIIDEANENIIDTGQTTYGTPNALRLDMMASAIRQADNLPSEGTKHKCIIMRLFAKLFQRRENLLNQDEIQLELRREQVAEQKQRRKFRNKMFRWFMFLLIAQYAGLAVLLGFAVKDGFVDKIQPLLSVIIPATLGETYAILRVMVNFVFSPGDFGGGKDLPEKKP